MNATKTEASADKTKERPIKDIQVCDAHGKPTTIAPGKVVFVNPNDLTIHPVLDRFPRMGNLDLSILRNNIEEKKRVLHPVLADLELRVYDGRHRTEIAREIKLALIPVFTNDNGDHQEVAMASYIARRNLDKGGIAFVLFEANPEIVAGRQVREQSKLLKGKDKADNIVAEKPGFETPSFSSLALKYEVPRQYFSYLAEMWDASSEEQWAQIRADIINGTPLTSVYRGFLGRNATSGKPRNAVQYFQLMSSTLTRQVPKAFKNWTEITETERNTLMNGFIETLPKWPQDDGLRIALRMVEFFQAQKAASAEGKK